MENRKEAEASFHDKREQDHNVLSEEEFLKKYPNKKFYSVTNASRSYTDKIYRSLAGKKVLDYCCGLGQLSIQLAKYGADVTGVDISAESIKTAQESAEKEGVASKCRFLVGDAEHTEFPDESFDFIICSGVLHHLDLDAAFKELARLVKKDGMIMGIEALAHNPVFMKYRRRTPDLRTAWEVEHILKVSDIQKGFTYFQDLNIRYFHLTVLAAVPFRNTFLFKPWRAVFNVIDAVLLKIPGLQKLAWQGIFVYRKKK